MRKDFAARINDPARPESPDISRLFSTFSPSSRAASIRGSRRGFGRPTRALVVGLSVCAAALGLADAPASVTADFSGAGGSETITAQPKGKAVRLEARDASGKRLAKADAPAPAGRNPSIAFQTGSIGSVGTLLEVAASSGGSVCRSVWRLRDGALSKLPILDGEKAVPDCEESASWTTRWDESRNEPAQYLRERTRETPRGKLHETRAFAFAGFDLRGDAKRSSIEINGVPIPEWFDEQLYRKAELENLFQRFGLSAFRTAPRLRFEVDPERGVFDVLLTDPTGELRLPVTASKPLEKGQTGVELVAGNPPARISVEIAHGTVPESVVVAGLGPRFDSSFAPAIHWSPAGIRVYATAEQELAQEALPGSWATEKDERVVIESISGQGAVRFGAAEVSLRVDEAPNGADLLLVPRDGSPPVWALALRGPNVLVRLPVACEAHRETGPDCRISGAGQSLKRIGSQLNVR
ncbi:MAG TPA: hypothetical protein VMR54_11780 [Thermoanaerobaculia bacterium]|nr:hypothetical protein [Thermoanaerobaculia bacterium]